MPYYSEHTKAIRSSCFDCAKFDGCNRCRDNDLNCKILPIAGCSVGDRYQILINLDEEDLHP